MGEMYTEQARDIPVSQLSLLHALAARILS